MIIVDYSSNSLPCLNCVPVRCVTICELTQTLYFKLSNAIKTESPHLSGCKPQAGGPEKQQMYLAT